MTNLQESSEANVASTTPQDLNRITGSLAISQNQDGRLWESDKILSFILNLSFLILLRLFADYW